MELNETQYFRNNFKNTFRYQVSCLDYSFILQISTFKKMFLNISIIGVTNETKGINLSP